MKSKLKNNPLAMSRTRVETRSAVLPELRLRAARFAGLSVLFLFGVWMAVLARDAHARAEMRLQCGRLGLVTLSNQFTLITYADGVSSKRVDATAAALASGTAGAGSSLRYTDGTVLTLRAARGADYMIQKQNGGMIACSRK